MFRLGSAGAVITLVAAPAAARADPLGQVPGYVALAVGAQGVGRSGIDAADPCGPGPLSPRAEFALEDNVDAGRLGGSVSASETQLRDFAPGAGAERAVHVGRLPAELRRRLREPARLPAAPVTPPVLDHRRSTVSSGRPGPDCERRSPDHGCPHERSTGDLLHEEVFGTVPHASSR